MKIIRTLTEMDFGRQNTPEQWPNHPVRRAARAILQNDQSCIALMYVASDHYYKLPGGGIDDGESIETALNRELLEEVGASSIQVLSEIGQVHSYLDKVHSKSEHFCFLAKVNGPIIEPARTEKEIAEGYETVWTKDIDEAIRLVESGTPAQYGHDFERLRELTFLHYAKSSKLISEE
jgi:8-oxo-dGTP diphosphatase